MQLRSHILQPLFLPAALACAVTCGSHDSQTSTTTLLISTLPSMPATTSPVFPLYASGPAIVDAKGNRVRLAAVNWYGAEPADYVVAGLQLQRFQTIVAEIKSLGWNAVLLPWSNQMYESNPVVGNYALAANASMQGQHALTILDQVVAPLTAANIMVILDNHNSNAEWCYSNDGNTLWYNSSYPEASWLADWQGMVQRYQSNPLVIGVDLGNEPRINATWRGSTTTDRHAAAQRGGNAVLATNPHLLIFVEGVNYALDLCGVAALPIQLNTAGQLVYEAHNYSRDYSGLTDYNSFVAKTYTGWGYLVTGPNPQPLWIGEFGTCNTATKCISSTNSAEGGYWFGFLTTYIQQNSLDWSYWAVNGAETTGSTRTYGAAETYGVLNPSWNGSAVDALTCRLQHL